MSRSISFKKTCQALNFNIETDMTPLWKTREISNKFLKRRLRLRLKTSRLSLKKTETHTLKKCLKMPLSSKSSKLRKRKKLETLKRLLQMSLRLITIKLML
jgi:hypothetical protein